MINDKFIHVWLKMVFRRFIKGQNTKSYIIPYNPLNLIQRLKLQLLWENSIYMPLSFKEQKSTYKNNRKPLTNSINNKDSIQRKSQKSHNKNNIIKSSQQKLINRSSLNIKTHIPHEEETSHKKLSKERLYQEILKSKPPYHVRQTFMKLHQSSFHKTDNEATQNKDGNQLLSSGEGTQSPSSRLKQSWGKLKQAVGKQVYFYDKYSKKDINISIIEEKSLLSNNQQNSLDSLNNFIIEGNNQDDNKSLLEKSHQSSSFDEDEEDEDWTLIEKQYERLIEDSDECSKRQAEYLRVLGLIGGENFQQSEQKVGGSEQLRQEFFASMNMQIQKLNEEIRKLHEVKNKKEIIIIEGSSEKRQTESKAREENMIEKKGNKGNEKDNIEGVDSVELQKEQGSMLVLQQNEKSLPLSIQRSGELKMIVQNLNRDSSNKKERYNEKKVLLSLVEEDNHDRSIVKQVKIQEGALQEEVEQGQLQGLEQEELVIIQQSQFQSQSITQQKSQQEFIRYMDKEYLQKKQSEDNQANLSLNNISKIINIKPKQLHNKSIEIQHQMKEKQEDEVVAMLENELRGKQQGKLRKRRQVIDGYKANLLNYQQNTDQDSKTNDKKANENKINNLFLKQDLLQLKQEQHQQQQQAIQNQIILKDEENSEIILMKQAPDNLNECDYQNSLQPEESQHQHNNKFFLALQAREKWIQSLQKDIQWKKNELQLIAKMKKILHNPYIEFQDY